MLGTVSKVIPISEHADFFYLSFRGPHAYEAKETGWRWPDGMGFRATLPDAMVMKAPDEKGQRLIRNFAQGGESISKMACPTPLTDEFNIQE